VLQHGNSAALQDWFSMIHHYWLQWLSEPIGKPLVNYGETKHGNCPETCPLNWRGPHAD
jgi:hypothetical protein